MPKIVTQDVGLRNHRPRRPNPAENLLVRITLGCQPPASLPPGFPKSRPKYLDFRDPGFTLGTNPAASIATEPAQLGTRMPLLIPANQAGGVHPNMPAKKPRPWLALIHAAEFLGEEAHNLRKKLDRASKLGPDGVVTAQLDGVEGRKLGRRWKVRVGKGWE